MFALLAALVFALKLFKVQIGDVDMLYLGLLLIALHLGLNQYVRTAYTNYRGNPQ